MTRLYTFLLSFSLAFAIHAQHIITKDFDSQILITSGISYFEDKENNLGFTEVLKSGSFAPIEKDVPNFGISPSTFWLRIRVRNESPREIYRLQVSQPGLDEIDFYQPLANGDYTVLRGGEVLHFNAREFFDPNYIFRLHVPHNTVSEFYLRVRSRDNLKIPVMLGTQEAIFEINKVRDFVMGIFAGIMVVMFLYNAFLYVTVRDRTYLVYILYLATVILTQVSIQGYTFQYLWPGSPFLAQWSPFIFPPLVGLASAYFMRMFLDTAHHTPRLDKGFKFFNFSYLIAFLFSVVGMYQVSYTLITLTASFLSMYMLVAAVIVSRNNYRPARFFLLAWSLFLFGVTVYAMTNLGVLPSNDFTFYIMPLGAAAEVVLLSLALADRINALKKEKEQSQAEALLVSQQNQQLIREQNVILEQKVHERTLELEETNGELNKTLTNLKEAQAQLVNAEKMASLGQLTAGIAHEINNPINFVSANLRPLKTDINEVFDVVHKYEEVVPGADNNQKLKDIEDFKRRIDLPYLKEEIGTLLHGIEDGAKRTAEIVSGLKNFSRLDESDLKEANINDGIESTLVLIRSTIPKNVEVILNLGRLPSIECYPGKLNQVFMNLLTNSIYAITKKPSGPHRLLITTFEKDGKIYAEFEDTGIGMTKEVKEKIFEPFFTTKDVGEGTGLGMSIVFKIIESHHAKMEVESKPGEGTKITLVLNKTINELVQKNKELLQQ
jgi:two-component system, NtrC family, sensor kinase